jgi:anaerobic sulfite reductase subunit A
MFQKWTANYEIFAPKRMEGEGCFSDTDIIRYEKVTSLEEIEWEKKSDYSFKEVLLAINETLFYFTEDQTTVPKGPEKEILIFLRSCDLHAVKRLDEIYLKNGFEDFYYARVREKAKFILMGCSQTCDSGFCASMGTNRAENYDAYLKVDGDCVYADFCCKELKDTVTNAKETEVCPEYVTENKEKVTLPKNLSNESFTNEIWKEYGARCIGCGRCNFVCPTCTCFTMQDIFYKENENVGERRRVWASCQVDGYTEMAGGHGFRKSQADRMRFKVMHKIYDFEKRFGYPMCVGCGRCEDVCPEYISYSNCVNRLAKEENEA